MKAERQETRHNNSPPTKKLRLRLGWGRGGVWVEVGLGWGSAIFNPAYLRRLDSMNETTHSVLDFLHLSLIGQGYKVSSNAILS